MTLEGRDDAGFQAMEAAIVFPLIVLFVLLGIFAVRAFAAANEVEGAAHAAARAASVGPAEMASTRANEAVNRSVSAGTVHCLGEPDVAVSFVDIGGITAVQARVTCSVKISDLGFGVSRTVSATAEEIIDPLRAVQP